MKMRRVWVVTGLMTMVLAAVLLQGCATAKPCKGRLEPINTSVTGRTP